jgi:hypothetical protein
MTLISSSGDHVMHQQDMPGAKPPSIEPEIISPGADWQRGSRISASTGQHHTTRIWITPVGPLGFAFFILLVVILAFAGIALFVGAALVGIAATGVFLIGGIVSSVLRGQVRRK